MELIVVMILAVLAGGYIGLYIRTWLLVLLTAIAVFLGLGMPRETLAAVLTIAYCAVAGSFFVAAWFIHITISGWVPEDWYKIFIRKS